MREYWYVFSKNPAVFSLAHTHYKYREQCRIPEGNQIMEEVFMPAFA